MKVQLFTRGGSLVATVDVDAQVSGRHPSAVRHGGELYVLQNGRYVRAEVADAREAVASDA